MNFKEILQKFKVTRRKIQATVEKSRIKLWLYSRKNLEKLCIRKVLYKNFEKILGKFQEILGKIQKKT